MISQLSYTLCSIRHRRTRRKAKRKELSQCRSPSAWRKRTRRSSPTTSTGSLTHSDPFFEPTFVSALTSVPWLVSARLSFVGGARHGLECWWCTQNFEYQMSNVVDKPLYILLQLLLSWACDASGSMLCPRTILVARVRCRSTSSVKQWRSPSCAGLSLRVRVMVLARMSLQQTM
jgi:hypothetical protein